jgi:putative restriction endonuclease
MRMTLEHPVPIGSIFKNRTEVRAAGLHKHPMAGIDYEPGGSALSIVVSGGYKEDKDFGNRIIYTGQGGQSSPGSNKQVEDQKLIRGNQALVISHLMQSPIKVIRGAGGDKKFSPSSGYRYDGYFLVTNHWFDYSADGPLVIRFELNQIEDQTFEISEQTISDTGKSKIPVGNQTPQRKIQSPTSTISRDPKVTKWIKETYKDCCQICSLTLTTPSSTYSQGAHIQGLGDPHNGKDTVNNMLCLCPNCHILFDFGAIYIQEDLKTIKNLITNTVQKLTIHKNHKLDLESVIHHRIHVAGIK